MILWYFFHILCQIEGLAVPSDWYTLYGNIFSELAPSLIMAPTEPTTLTEIYVTALSTEAYQVAGSILEDWLSKDRKILRLGAVHTFLSNDLPLNGHGTSPRSLQFRLDMVEPVLQGFAEKGKTRFVVTLDDLSSASEEVSDEESEDGIEIDEAFLASSTFTRFSSQPNGHDSKDGDKVLQFQTHPLSVPGNISDEHNTLYLRTADLGRVGILSGDWVCTRCQS